MCASVGVVGVYRFDRARLDSIDTDKDQVPAGGEAGIELVSTQFKHA